MIAGASTRGRGTAWAVALGLAAFVARTPDVVGLPRPPGDEVAATVDLTAHVDDRLRVSLDLRLRGKAAIVARAYKRAPRLLAIVAERAAGLGGKNRPGLWPDPG